MPLRLLGVLLLITLCSFGPLSSARAGGFEYPGDGTRGMGRGGAFYARADDPMATLYNPAALAKTVGLQLMFGGHGTFMKACIDRTGSYGDQTPTGTFIQDPNVTDGFIDISAVPHAQICNGSRFSAIPSLGMSWRLNKNVGLGFGLFVPNSVQRMEYGAKDGTTDRRFMGGRLPSPVRYQLIASDLIVAYPTFGIGVRALPRLYLGAAFSTGFADLKFRAAIRVQPSVGESPVGDYVAAVEATDYFVPRIMVSLHAVPTDNWDITVGFRYEDQIRANGDINLDRVDGRHLEGTVNFKAPRPWWLHFGVRYSQRLAPRVDDPNRISQLSGRIEDEMARERWDIELDVVYERNSMVKSFDIDSVINADPLLDGLGIQDTSISVPHNWRDQVSVRIGGDYNVIPGWLALRGGLSFESSAVPKGFEVPDFFPLRRVGIHMGSTLRIKNVDLSAAYAVFFLQAADNRGNGKIKQIAAQVEGLGTADPDDIAVVNGGRYDARIHVISGMITWHIR